MSDSIMILRDIVVTRDSLTGIAFKDSAVALAMRDVRSIEVRKLDEKKLARHALVAIAAYLAFRILFTVFFATAAT